MAQNPATPLLNRLQKAHDDVVNFVNNSWASKLPGVKQVNQNNGTDTPYGRKWLAGQAAAATSTFAKQQAAKKSPVSVKKPMKKGK